MTINSVVESRVVEIEPDLLWRVAKELQEALGFLP